MITFREMSFSYSDKKGLLFQALNLELQAGNVCGLLGKNGAGKTTLLKIIAGLLFPQLGECTRFGVDAKNREPKSLADMYFVPEEFYVPKLTAKNYVDLYAPFYPLFDRKLFITCLNEFDIHDDKLLPTFSYGQKKKFLISFAIATQCKIILFDEPTNGLDIPSKSQFRKLIAANMTDEKLFIISTHQVHDVEKLVDRIVIVDEGEIIINSSLSTMMKAITVEQVSSEPSLNSCLYYEKNLSGYTVVTENNLNTENHIDLELLFNMIVSNKEKSVKIFSGEK